MTIANQVVGSQQRPGDRPEPVPRSRAVETRGLQHRLRQRLQGREIDQHEIAECLPHADGDQRPQRAAGIGQPRNRRQADQVKQIIGEPVIGVENPQPDGRRRHGRQYHRRVEQRAESAGAAQSLVERDRQRQAKPDAERYGKKRINRRVAQDTPKQRIGEQLAIVRQIRSSSAPAKSRPIYGTTGRRGRPADNNSKSKRGERGKHYRGTAQSDEASASVGRHVADARLWLR